MPSILRKCLTWLAVLLFCTACLHEHKNSPNSPTKNENFPDSLTKNENPPNQLQTHDPIIAIGDVHADFSALTRALRLGGAIDTNNRWIGGDMTVVQLGDFLDRGPEDRKVIDYLIALQAEAREAGGRLVILNGNHEIMNAIYYNDYIHDLAWAGFEDIPYDTSNPLFANLPVYQRGRYAAFTPGKQYALVLANFPVIYVQDSLVFVHASLFPKHVHYGIAQINLKIQQWLKGEISEPKEITESELFWDRTYSLNPSPADCKTLETTLSLIPARALVVGHTFNLDGITSACGGKVWRVDVGMSVYYGGKVSVLKIEDGHFHILK